MKLYLSPRPAIGRHVSVALAAVAAAAALIMSPSVAHAQQTTVINNEGEASGYAGPNWMVLSSGLLIFGGTYTASLVVAGTSDHAGDKLLYAPIIGPWLDMTNRCPSNGNCSSSQTAAVAGLAVDGVFQGLGALTIATAFLLPGRHRRGMAQSASGMTFSVLPASYGRGIPGLTAVGTF
jgi:hypothetical protein